MLDSPLEIGKSLTIQGPGAGLLAISGDNRLRVFQVDSFWNVTISGLTIENGNGNGAADPEGYYYDRGGGILNFGALTLSACNVTGNYAATTTELQVGGGIDNEGTMTLSGCTVTGNVSGYPHNNGAPAGEGGGIYNDGTMTLSGCTVTNNTCYYSGGGIYNATQGHLTTLSSVVQNNTASYGAGIDNGGWMQISGSTVSGNTASVGGGIDNAGTMTLSGCNVTNNSTGLVRGVGEGGGIYNDGTTTLSGCTVTNNTSEMGGGIYNDAQGHLTVLSSVVSGNIPSKWYDIYNLGWISISQDSTVGKINRK
jgi:hypothetical protein